MMTTTLSAVERQRLIEQYTRGHPAVEDALAGASDAERFPTRRR
jgi:hypothetical protein